MAYDASSLGQFQELFDLAKSNFHMEHVHLPKGELERQWNDKATELFSQFGWSPTMNKTSDSIVPNNGPKMSRSQTHQPSTHRRTSSMQRKTSDPMGTRKSRATVLPTVPPMAAPPKKRTETVIRKPRRTNTGRRQSMPVVPEVATTEFSPEQYLMQHPVHFTREASMQGSPPGYQQMAHSLVFPQSTAPFAQSPPSNDSREPSPVFSMYMSRESSNVTSDLGESLDMMRIRSEQCAFSLDREPGIYSSSLPDTTNTAWQIPPPQFSTPPANTTGFNERPYSAQSPSILSDETVTDDTIDQHGKPCTTAMRTCRLTEQPTSFNFGPDHNDPMSVPMVPVLSHDGREKCAIPRAAARSQIRTKLKCQQCNKHPGGFRGEHELQRHISRAHPQGKRQVWRNFDASPDGTFLANCKSCTGGKLYGAYYNAAAHLRRCHFCPKDAAPKVKGVATRAGKGGGNWPRMEDLKDIWVIEFIEEMNPTTRNTTMTRVSPMTTIPTTTIPTTDESSDDIEESMFDFTGAGCSTTYNPPLQSMATASSVQPPPPYPTKAFDSPTTVIGEDVALPPYTSAILTQAYPALSQEPFGFPNDFSFSIDTDFQGFSSSSGSAPGVDV